MKGEVPMKTGDEYDALTRWRRFLHWRAGDRKDIKRGFRRRVRRAVRRLLRKDVSDE